MDGCADDAVGGGGGGGATEVDAGRVADLVAVVDFERDGRGCGREAVIVRPLGFGATCEPGSDEGCVDGGVRGNVTRVGRGTAEPAVVLPDDEHAVSASVIATIAAAGTDQRAISCLCAGRSSTASSGDGASVRRATGSTSSSTPSRR